MNLDQLKEKALALQAEITLEDMQNQPTLSRPPRIKIHQANSVNAPDESTPGGFYSDTSFCEPTESIRAIIFGQNDGRRKSTPYGGANNHIICACAVSESMQGVPFVEGDNDKWHPGEEVRDCWYCPDYLPGKGMPKLPRLGSDDTKCTTYRQLALNVLTEDDTVNGIPAKLEFGASIFKKEYYKMTPFEVDGVLFGPIDFLTYQLKTLGLPTHSTVVVIRTQKIKTDKGVVFAPVFGIENILSKDDLNFSRTFAQTNLPSLALTGKTALIDMAEHVSDEESESEGGYGEDGKDAYDLSAYSAAPDDDNDPL